MKLSCIVPAHNESESIEKVIGALVSKFQKHRVDYEIIAVDDNSLDNTAVILKRISYSNNRIRIINRKGYPGFGRAIMAGFEHARGEAICIVMGDDSDDPDDVIKLFEKLKEGYDLVYGSRFIKGSHVYDYPFLKLVLNRIANHFIRIIFSMPDESDITNAFKIYRREVIQAIQPIQSTEFNITLELPLKAELKGFKRSCVPVNWYGRKSDVSKFSIFKMSKCYFWILIKLWFFKMLQCFKGK